MPLGHVLLAHIDIPERLLGALVVLLLSVMVAFTVRAVRGTPKGLVVRPGAPSCECGTATKWMLPDNHWHCERCNLPVLRPLACSTCQGPARWLRESNAWGCDRCRVLLPTAAPRA